MLYGYKILVYCTSKVHESKFCEFLTTLNEELVPNNWRVMVFCTETDLYNKDRNNKGEANIFDLINYDIADAVLFTEEKILDSDIKNKIIENAQQRNLPVFIYEGTRPDTYNIKFDTKKGFYKVCHHIINQHGIRELHFMAGKKGFWQSEERLEVFKQVLKENNIPFDKSMISYGDFWEYPTTIATQKLLDSGNIPKAIICANDTMALAVTNVLKKNGYRCPEDIIVSGFDGIEEIFYSNPKITSVLCNYQTLGIGIADFILEVDTVHTKPYTRLIESSFMLSESCGCQPITPSHSLEFITKLTERYNVFRNSEKSLNNMSVLIHDANSLDEVKSILKSDLLYNTRFLVKTECTDENLDPNYSHTDSTYGNSMYVLLDSDTNRKLKSNFIKTEELIPSMKHVLDKYKKPLIFMAVNNIDMPIGYLCFCFTNYDVRNFLRMSQISLWLGNAIYGYRNVKFQKGLKQKIEEIYSHDSMTGFYNRNGFIKLYETLLIDPAVKKVSMAMADLDNLKYINDNFGHSEGDNAITIVARALEKAQKNGYYCRYGGDEMLAIYPFETKPETLQAEVNKYLEQYNSISGKPYTVSASVGVYNSPKTDFDELFKNADALMYAEKLLNKNRRQ
jgi:diguanylate cyclase (GGDEF)-like protein